MRELGSAISRPEVERCCVQAGEAWGPSAVSQGQCCWSMSRGKGTFILEDALPRRCKLLAHRPSLAGRSVFWAQGDFFLIWMIAKLRNRKFLPNPVFHSFLWETRRAGNSEPTFLSSGEVAACPFWFPRVPPHCSLQCHTWPLLPICITSAWPLCVYVSPTSLLHWWGD